MKFDYRIKYYIWLFIPTQWILEYLSGSTGSDWETDQQAWSMD